jgi:hypothetical protein
MQLLAIEAQSVVALRRVLVIGDVIVTITVTSIQQWCHAALRKGPRDGRSRGPLTSRDEPSRSRARALGGAGGAGPNRERQEGRGGAGAAGQAGGPRARAPGILHVWAVTGGHGQSRGGCGAVTAAGLQARRGGPRARTPGTLHWAVGHGRSLCLGRAATGGHGRSRAVTDSRSVHCRGWAAGRVGGPTSHRSRPVTAGHGWPRHHGHGAQRAFAGGRCTGGHAVTARLPG